MCFIPKIQLLNCIGGLSLMRGSHDLSSHNITLRDCNNLIALTHIELLLGCAIPVWIWCYLRSSPEIDLFPSSLKLLPHLGWVTVGIGDSMVQILSIIQFYFMLGSYCW